MLRKLFKHEFKATARVYALLYVLVAVFTFMIILYGRIFGDNIGKLTGWLRGFMETIAVLLGIGYFVVLIAVNILTLIYLIYRFYQTMVCDEGYLTHTLPVTTGQLIFVKTVTAFCFQVLSAVVTMFSVLIFIVGAGSWSEFASGYEEFILTLKEQEVWGTNLAILVFLAVLIIIAMIIFNILTYYMCISAGNLFNSHKLLGSVVVYLLFNVAKGIISTIIIIFGAWTATERLDKMVESSVSIDNIERVLETPSEVIEFLNGYMAAGVVVIAIGCGILFFVSRYILKNKLNLA